MSAHTPTPWPSDIREDGPSVYVVIDSEFANGSTKPATRWSSIRVSGNNGNNAASNLAHIVRCVNAHDELVAALRQIVSEDADGAGYYAHIAAAALAKVAP